MSGNTIQIERILYKAQVKKEFVFECDLGNVRCVLKYEDSSNYRCDCMRIYYHMLCNGQTLARQDALLIEIYLSSQDQELFSLAIETYALLDGFPVRQPVLSSLTERISNRSTLPHILKVFAKVKTNQLPRECLLDICTVVSTVPDDPSIQKQALEILSKAVAPVTCRWALEKIASSLLYVVDNTKEEALIDLAANGICKMIHMGYRSTDAMPDLFVVLRKAYHFTCSETVRHDIVFSLLSLVKYGGYKCHTINEVLELDRDNLAYSYLKRIRAEKSQLSKKDLIVLLEGITRGKFQSKALVNCLVAVKLGLKKLNYRNIPSDILENTQKMISWVKKCNLKHCTEALVKEIEKHLQTSVEMPSKSDSNRLCLKKGPTRKVLGEKTEQMSETQETRVKELHKSKSSAIDLEDILGDEYGKFFNTEYEPSRLQGGSNQAWYRTYWREYLILENLVKGGVPLKEGDFKFINSKLFEGFDSMWWGPLYWQKYLKIKGRILKGATQNGQLPPVNILDKLENYLQGKYLFMNGVFQFSEDVIFILNEVVKQGRSLNESTVHSIRKNFMHCSKALELLNSIAQKQRVNVKNLERLILNRHKSLLACGLFYQSVKQTGRLTTVAVNNMCWIMDNDSYQKEARCKAIASLTIYSSKGHTLPTEAIEKLAQIHGKVSPKIISDSDQELLKNTVYCMKVAAKTQQFPSTVLEYLAIYVTNLEKQSNQLDLHLCETLRERLDKHDLLKEKTLHKLTTVFQKNVDENLRVRVAWLVLAAVQNGQHLNFCGIDNIIACFQDYIAYPMSQIFTSFLLIETRKKHSIAHSHQIELANLISRNFPPNIKQSAMEIILYSVTKNPLEIPEECAKSVLKGLTDFDHQTRLTAGKAMIHIVESNLNSPCDITLIIHKLLKEDNLTEVCLDILMKLTKTMRAISDPCIVSVLSLISRNSDRVIRQKAMQVLQTTQQYQLLNSELVMQLDLEEDFNILQSQIHESNEIKSFKEEDIVIQSLKNIITSLSKSVHQKLRLSLNNLCCLTNVLVTAEKKIQSECVTALEIIIQNEHSLPMECVEKIEQYFLQNQQSKRVNILHGLTEKGHMLSEKTMSMLSAKQQVIVLKCYSLQDKNLPSDAMSKLTVWFNQYSDLCNDILCILHNLVDCGTMDISMDILYKALSGENRSHFTIALDITQSITLHDPTALSSEIVSFLEEAWINQSKSSFYSDDAKSTLKNCLQYLENITEPTKTLLSLDNLYPVTETGDIDDEIKVIKSIKDLVRPNIEIDFARLVFALECTDSEEVQLEIINSLELLVNASEVTFELDILNVLGKFLCFSFSQQTIIKILRKVNFSTQSEVNDSYFITVLLVFANCTQCRELYKNVKAVLQKLSDFSQKAMMFYQKDNILHKFLLSLKNKGTIHTLEPLQTSDFIPLYYISQVSEMLLTENYCIKHVEEFLNHLLNNRSQQITADLVSASLVQMNTSRCLCTLPRSHWGTALSFVKSATNKLTWLTWECDAVMLKYLDEKEILQSYRQAMIRGITERTDFAPVLLKCRDVIDTHSNDPQVILDVLDIAIVSSRYQKLPENIFQFIAHLHKSENLCVSKKAFTVLKNCLTHFQRTDEIVKFDHLLVSTIPADLLSRSGNLNLHVLTVVSFCEFYDPSIIKDCEFNLWCRQFLCNEIVKRTGHPSDSVILQFYQCLDSLEEYNEYEIDDEKRDELLMSLVEKQKQFKLDLEQVSNILILLKIGDAKCQDILNRELCFEGWYSQLKHLWAREWFVIPYSETMIDVLESEQMDIVTLDKIVNFPCHDSSGQLASSLVGYLLKESINTSELSTILSHMPREASFSEWNIALNCIGTVRQVALLWPSEYEKVMKMGKTIMCLANRGFSQELFIHLLTYLEKEKLDLQQRLKSFMQIIDMLFEYDVSRSSNCFFLQQVINIVSTSASNVWVKEIHKIVVNEKFMSNAKDKSLKELIKEYCTLNKFEEKQIEKYQKLFGDIKMKSKQDSINTWSKNDIHSWAQGIKSDKKIDVVQTVAVMKHATLLTYGFEPRNAQILSLLILLEHPKGCLSQIGTGEGKSIIIAMFAAIKALQGVSVDIVTSSPILATRDADDKARFYDLFGLTVGDNDKEVLKNGAKECYSKDIVYGDCANFQFDILRHEYSKKGTRGDRKFGIVVVDEVDNMMIDERTKIAKLASNFPAMENLQQVLAIIWQQLVYMSTRFITYNDKLYIQKNKSDDWIEVEKEPREFIKSILTDHITTAVRKEGGQIKVPCHLQHFVESQIPHYVENAITALNDMEENKEYLIKEDQQGIKRITPVDSQNTGVVQECTTWSDGLHQFLQFKHGLKLTPETLTTNFLSNKAFIQRYGQNIYGVTGTIGSTESKRFLQKCYNIEIALLPSCKPKQFLEFPPVITASEKEWLEVIIDSAKGEITKERAVLIICETIKLAKDIVELIDKTTEIPLSRIKQYTRNDVDHEENVEAITEAGEIIIATNLAGRGTDIKPCELVQQNGGLHVILTFLPCNLRVEQQAFGRTARKGKYGTAQLILNRKSLSEMVETANRLDTQGEEVSVDMNRIADMKMIRDKLESMHLINFTATELDILDKQEHFFQKFCCLLEKKNTDDPFTRMTIEEQWGIWLKVTDFKGTELKEITSSFMEFETKILQSKSFQEVCTNPCYLINKAKELINSSDKDADALLDRAIEIDEVFSYNAYGIKAYMKLKLQETKWFSYTAKKQLQKQLYVMNEYIIPQSPFFLLDKKATKTNQLHQQLEKRAEILNHIKSNAEQVVHSIEKYQRLVSIEMVDKSKGTRVKTFDSIFSQEKCFRILENNANCCHYLIGFHNLPKYNNDLRTDDQCENTLIHLDSTVATNIVYRDLNRGAAVEVFKILKKYGKCSAIVPNLNQHNIDEVHQRACLNFDKLCSRCTLSKKPRDSKKRRLSISYADITEEKIELLFHRIDWPLNLSLESISKEKVLELIKTIDEIGEEKDSAIADSRNFILYIHASDKDSAKQIIEKADRSRHSLEVSWESLEEKFLKSDYVKEEIMEVSNMGFYCLINIKEKKPVPWRSCLLAALLGLGQIIVGTVLCATGIGMSSGIGLISEGVCDIYATVEGAITRQFSWQDYGIQKSVSLALAITTSGISKISKAVKTSKCTAKTAAKAGTKVTAKAAAEEVGTKALVEQTQSMTRKTVQGPVTNKLELAMKQVVVTIVEEGAKRAINFGIDKALEQLFNLAQKEIKGQVEIQMDKYFENEENHSNLLMNRLLNSEMSLSQNIEKCAMEIINPEKSKWMGALKAYISGVGNMISNEIGGGKAQAIFRICELSTDSVKAISEIGVLIPNFFSQLEKQLKDICVNLKLDREWLNDKLKDTCTDERSKEEIINNLLENECLKLQYVNTDISQGAETAKVNGIIQKLVDQYKILSSELQQCRKNLKVQIIHAVSLKVIQILESGVIKPWLQEGTNLLVNKVSEHVQRKFDSPTRSAKHGNTLSEKLYQHAARKKLDRLNRKLAHGGDRSMEKNAYQLSAHDHEFLSGLIYGVSSSDQGSMILLGAVSNITGMNVEIGSKGSPKEGVISLQYDKAKGSNSGHWSICGQNIITSSGKNNCFFDAVGSRVGKTGNEMRALIANHIADNPHFYLKMKPALNLISSTCRNPIRRNQLLMIGGRSVKWAKKTIGGSDPENSVKLKDLNVEIVKKLITFTPNPKPTSETPDKQASLYQWLSGTGITKTKEKMLMSDGKEKDIPVFNYKLNDYTHETQIAQYIKHCVQTNQTESICIRARAHDGETYTGRVDFPKNKGEKRGDFKVFSLKEMIDGKLVFTSNNMSYTDNTNPHLIKLLPAYEPARHWLYATVPQLALQTGSLKKVREICQLVNGTPSMQKKAVEEIQKQCQPFPELHIRLPDNMSAEWQRFKKCSNRTRTESYPK